MRAEEVLGRRFEPASQKQWYVGGRDSDCVIKGEKPVVLLVLQSVGLTISETLLGTADEVIQKAGRTGPSYRRASRQD